MNLQHKVERVVIATERCRKFCREKFDNCPEDCPMWPIYLAKHKRNPNAWAREWYCHYHQSEEYPKEIRPGSKTAPWIKERREETSEACVREQSEHCVMD